MPQIVHKILEEEAQDPKRFLSENDVIGTVRDK
jgi:hypothetical protein